MKQTTFNELYINELADLLSAENQLVRALPKLISAVETKDLELALSDHLERTHAHVDRLNQVFKMLNMSPKQETCEAMKGLLKEGESVVNDMPAGPVRDAALIGACQRVEHYEMAAYGTARAFAESLGYNDQAKVLGQTLEEESDSNERLTKIAIKQVNPMAKAESLTGQRR